jgi:hypothetical protein
MRAKWSERVGVCTVGNQQYTIIIIMNVMSNNNNKWNGEIEKL